MKCRRRDLTLLAIAVLAVAAVGSAERGDDAKRLSKNGELRSEMDGVDVVVQYGRPQVRDRKIWGGLVPFERVWRTGADEATTIIFGRDVRVEGQPLGKGRYALFTIPGMESWTVVFNNTPDQWGAFSYDEADDALRVTVEPRAADHVETLTFESDADSIVLRWEKLAVAVSVQADD